MTTFHQRLISERHRLGLTQEELGQTGGVTKLSQFNYEKGARHPNSEYLEKIGKAGVDLYYLLTGKRLVALQKDMSVAPAEK